MRQQRKLLAVLLLVIGLLAGCGDKDEPATPTATQPAAVSAGQSADPAGDAAKGKQLFLGTCAACHGPTGEGVKGLGKDMTHSEFIAGLSDADLMDFIKKGRPIDDPLNTTGVMMPPKGGNPTLTDAQLMDIIAFIRSIHQ
ncbi:MAG TPA: c-type cytochrome [Caldilineaceae bacterium]|nr:c-type cytochrome [Caldilineaceae bacterium]